uniref:ABC transmembrane type-1 domain-containing protein n=1 Tax=Steinernema glaseri TaxID=37863 RepID=A0A1I7YXG8_9BILA
MDPSFGNSVGKLVNTTDVMLLNLTERILTASSFLSFALPLIVVLCLVLMLLVDCIVACYTALFIRVFFEAKKHNHDIDRK